MQHAIERVGPGGSHERRWTEKKDWFRPMLSELIGAATESANVWSRLPCASIGQPRSSARQGFASCHRLEERLWSGMNTLMQLTFH